MDTIEYVMNTKTGCVFVKDAQLAERDDLAPCTLEGVRIYPGRADVKEVVLDPDVEKALQDVLDPALKVKEPKAKGSKKQKTPDTE